MGKVTGIGGVVGYAVLVLVVAAAAIGSGCGSSNAIVITQSRTTAPGPFERLAVFVSLPSGGGDRGIYHGVKKVMPGELGAPSRTLTATSRDTGHAMLARLP
jgi:hypothetical protein